MHQFIIALIGSFLITLLVGKKVIIQLKKIQPYGQPIRINGPETHHKKAGTVTMGGIIIIFCTIICTLLFCKINAQLLIILFVMISYGLIGFIDDYTKVIKKNTNGTKAIIRLIIEFLIAGISLWLIKKYINQTTYVNIPLLDNAVNFGASYYLLASIAIVGTANATNLTDGLDGLLSGTVIMIFISFCIISYMIIDGHFYPEAKYGFMKYPNAILELTVFYATIIGILIGFLWYNANPARVFMGDVGSLSLGGMIGIIAVLLRQEIFLIIIGGLFVCEALSVIIQVGSYKLRGKRVFLMTPIHHHFEKLGWHENTIVIRFWIVNFILCVLGIFLTTI